MLTKLHINRFDAQYSLMLVHIQNLKHIRCAQEMRRAHNSRIFVRNKAMMHSHYA